MFVLRDYAVGDRFGIGKKEEDAKANHKQYQS